MKAASLNHVYRLVWNTLSQSWVVVSEITRSRGKPSSGRLGAVLAALGLSAMPYLSYAEPTGGVVTAGSGTVHQSGAVTTIQQNSQQLSLNWDTFNIAAHETVNFIQPNATALAVNRILDTNGSRILGNINANGQIWLINPNGVYFGQGAQINVGSLLASTLNPLGNLTTDGTQVFGNGGNGRVVNEGTIRALNGGYVALIGNQVSNAGSIQASQGAVALGAGSQVSVTFADNQLLSLTVDKSTLNNLAENKGLIQADGGVALMSAGARDSLLASVVNNEGIIEARTVDHKEGKIILLGGMAAGTTKVAGTLDASAQTGNGGFIETSAAKVQVADGAQVTTQAQNGKTGLWLIDPTDFSIESGNGARTDSSIGASTLASNLATTDVSIQTLAPGSEQGDINVNAAVNWVSNNDLTLNAHRNININQSITATGATAKLNLWYGQGAVAAGNTSTYNVNAKVNLQAGDNFSTKLGSNGATTEYKVITALGVEGSTTGADLQGMNGNLRGNYVLGADINASATSTWNSGAGFNPIGNNSTSSNASRFTGKFNGLGHTISSLTINRTSTNFVGLFGYTSDAKISNVGMVSGSVSGNDYVGSLVGFNYSSNISNAYATGSVSGHDDVGGLLGAHYSLVNFPATLSNVYATGSVSGHDDVGGLLGWNAYSSLSNAYATGSVSGSMNVGGLVGLNGRSSLSNAYATGDVSGSNYVGGLVGQNYGSSISNAYATGSVSGSTYIGGLVGDNPFASVSPISNSYYANTTGQNDSGKGVKKTISQLASSLSGLGFDSTVWGNGNNQTTPYLLSMSDFATAGSVYLASDAAASTLYSVILNVSQLQAINNALSGSYVLGNNIDASATATWNSDGAVTPTYAGFNPLGNLSTRFTGTFDGLHHTINNLYINRPSASYVGLFGATSGATIANVGISGGSVTGSGFVGGLVGVANSSTVSNAYTSGVVTGSDFVGGLAGRINFGGISNAYATGVVTGNNIVGGLVGANVGGSISNTYAMVSVSGSNSVGGLVGDATGSISQSYYAGAINQPDNNLGIRKTGDQMMQQSTFASWDISANGGENTVWRIYEGQTSPLLRSFLTTFNLTPDYDGSATALTNIGSVTIPTGADADKIRGTQTGNAVTLTSPEAGSYVATADITGLYSSQQGYDLTATRTLTTAGSAAGEIKLDNGVSWTNGTLNIQGNVTDPGAISSANGAFNLQGGTWSQVSSSNAAFNVKDFAISGGTFRRFVGGDGAAANPYKISDVYGLQGVGSEGMSGLNYVLANDIDASSTRGWNDGLLDFSNSYQTILQPVKLGFNPLGNSTTPFTGTFDGLGHTINNLYIYRFYTNDIGLFGAVDGSSISHVGLVDVSIRGFMNTAGLIGNMISGNVSHSYVTGAIYPRAGWFSSGGLVAYNSGTISDSYANVSVGGTGYTGGLVGTNAGLIERSYATGRVYGFGNGGLVGVNTATGVIRESYSENSNVGDNGYAGIGGLVGVNQGLIENSYASSTYEQYSDGGPMGGLVGVNSGTIKNSYANVYMNIVVDFGPYGALVGRNSGGTVINSFFNKDHLGFTTSDGLTTGQLHTLSTFTNAGWDISANGGENTVWRIYDGQTAPLLRSFLTQVDLGTVNTTYNGSTQTGASAPNTLDSSHVFGNAASGRNAGAYSTGYYSDQQGYDFVGGGLNIAQKALTVTATAVTKTYDGTTDTNATASVGALASGDSVNSAGSVSFTDKDAGSNKTVKASGVTIKDGTGADMTNNYAISYVDNTSSAINKAILTFAVSSVQFKQYDGNRDAVVNLSSGVNSNGNLPGVSGLVGNEKFAAIAGDSLNRAITATGKFATADAATQQVSDFTFSFGDGLNGALASNYQPVLGSLNGTIQPRTIVLNGASVTAADKVYDGNLVANVSVSGGVFRTYTSTPSGTSYGADNQLVGNERLGTTTATGLFSSKDAANDKTVNLNYRLADGVAGDGFTAGKASNYQLVTNNNGITTSLPFSVKASIFKKELSFTGATIAVADKTYDGTHDATLTVTGGTLSGFVGTEILNAPTVTAKFDDQNAGTDKAVTVKYALADNRINPRTLILASNYFVADTQSQADITPRVLTVSDIATANKVYDGNTTATITGQGTLNNLVKGEDLQLTTTGVFNSQNVTGADRVITTSTIANGSNGLAANYTLSNTQNRLDATISTRDITVSDIAADNKVYDGNRIAVISNAGRLNHLVSGESLTLTTTGAFDQQNAGNHVITTTSQIDDGANNSGLASNYTLTNPANLLRGSIAQATLTYVADPVSVLQGQTPGLTGRVTGFVNGETFADLFAKQTVQWASPNANLNLPGSYAVEGSGLTANNYALVQASGNASALTVQGGTGETITQLQQAQSGALPPVSSTVVETNLSNIAPAAGQQDQDTDKDSNAQANNNDVSLLTVTPPVNLPPSMGAGL